MTKNTKNILLIACGVALSIALISLGEWINLHTTAAGEIQMEHYTGGASLANYIGEHEGDIKRKYGFYFGQLDDRRMKQQEFLIYPLIAVAIALFVGILAHRRAVLLTAICLMPFLYYVLSNPWLWGRRLHLAAVYVLVALVITFLIDRIKGRARGSQTTHV